jgi:hypothetical protein
MEAIIKITVEDKITIHERIRMRSKEPGFREYAGETICGDEWSSSHQMWVTKTRAIDEKHDRYEERVIDPETGAILHECAEPLSAHQGHGSAKKHPASP